MRLWVGGSAYFGRWMVARPRVCSGGRFGVRWLGSTCSCEIYTQNLMALIASLVAHHPLTEAHHLKSDRFKPNRTTNHG
jgi:hypothetical protein